MYAKQNRAEVRERAEIRAPVSAAAADGKKEKEANLAFLSHWDTVSVSNNLNPRLLAII